MEILLPAERRHAGNLGKALGKTQCIFQEYVIIKTQNVFVFREKEDF